MGVAWTQLPVVYNSAIRGDTSANLRSDIDGTLLAAGWVHDRAISNGFIYRFSSPQLLVAKCRIQDTGRTILGSPMLDVQFMSDDEARTGLVYPIGFRDGTVAGDLHPHYQMVAGKCQMFLSYPGHVNADVGTVYGGIPRLPLTVTGDCLIDQPEPLLTDELWWSGGLLGNGNDTNIRNSHFIYRAYSFCQNHILFNNTVTEDPSTGPLQLFPLTPTFNVDAAFVFGPLILKYVDQQPLVIDPLLGWRFAIRGQLWDSFQLTTQELVIDKQITTTETDGVNSFTATWIAFNRSVDPARANEGTLWCTLYLLIKLEVQGEEESNYAY